jgi:hypothetical protein
VRRAFISRSSRLPSATAFPRCSCQPPIRLLRLLRLALTPNSRQLQSETSASYEPKHDAYQLPRQAKAKRVSDKLADAGCGLRLYHHMYRDFWSALDVGLGTEEPDPVAMTPMYVASVSHAYLLTDTCVSVIASSSKRLRRSRRGCPTFSIM